MKLETNWFKPDASGSGKATGSFHRTVPRRTGTYQPIMMRLRNEMTLSSKEVGNPKDGRYLWYSAASRLFGLEFFSCREDPPPFSWEAQSTTRYVKTSKNPSRGDIDQMPDQRNIREHTEPAEKGPLPWSEFLRGLGPRARLARAPPFMSDLVVVIRGPRHVAAAAYDLERR